VLAYHEYSMRDFPLLFTLPLDIYSYVELLLYEYYYILYCCNTVLCRSSTSTNTETWHSFIISKEKSLANSLTLLAFHIKTREFFSDFPSQFPIASILNQLGV